MGLLASAAFCVSILLVSDASAALFQGRGTWQGRFYCSYCRNDGELQSFIVSTVNTYVPRWNIGDTVGRASRGTASGR